MIVIRSRGLFVCILIILDFLLSACSNALDSGPTNLTITALLPASIESSVPADTQWQAKFYDNGQPLEDVIPQSQSVDGNYSLTLKVSAGEHLFSVRFEAFSPSVFQASVYLPMFEISGPAALNIPDDLTANNSVLLDRRGRYDYNFDDDKDGRNNLDELTGRTSPLIDQVAPKIPADAILVASNLSRQGFILAWPPAIETAPGGFDINYQVKSSPSPITTVDEFNAANDGFSSELLVNAQSLVLTDIAAYNNHYWTVAASDSFHNLSLYPSLQVTLQKGAEPVIQLPASPQVLVNGVNSIPASSAEINNYLQSVTCTDAEDGALTVTSNEPASFSLGTTYVLFSCSDSDGNLVSTTGSVQIMQTAVLVSALQNPVTSENGDSIQLSVSLNATPNSPVTVNLISSDETEGKVDQAMLTFTQANVSQTVLVTGQDDMQVDGPIDYNILLSTSGGDARFTGLSNSVAFINLDNDSAIAPVIATQPADQFVAVDFSTTTAVYPVSFSVDASGGTTLTYQWYRNNGSAGAFQPITGATAASYPIAAVSLADNGAQFYVVVSNDASLSVQSATATLTVDHIPLAVNDVFTIKADTAQVIDVLANDTDPDSDTLSSSNIVINQPPGQGSVNIGSNGLQYTPVTGSFGSDSFQYTITDSRGATSNPATVDINVVSPPSYSGPTRFDIDENTSIVANVSATSPLPVSYALSGTDAAIFSVDSSGTVSFNQLPDYETATSTLYNLQVDISDSIGSLTNVPISVILHNLPDQLDANVIQASTPADSPSFEATADYAGNIYVVVQGPSSPPNQVTLYQTSSTGVVTATSPATNITPFPHMNVLEYDGADTVVGAAYNAGEIGILRYSIANNSVDWVKTTLTVDIAAVITEMTVKNGYIYLLIRDVNGTDDYVCRFSVANPLNVDNSFNANNSDPSPVTGCKQIVSSKSRSSVYYVDVLADGTFYVNGSAGPNNSSQMFALWKFTAAAALDTTFATNGELLLSGSTGFSAFTRSMLVGGSLYINGTNIDTTNGTYDVVLMKVDGGSVTWLREYPLLGVPNYLLWNNTLQRVVVMSQFRDGSINTNYVWQFDSNGNLDPKFNANPAANEIVGRVQDTRPVTDPLANFWYKMFFLPDGSYTVIGASNPNLNAGQPQFPVLYSIH